MGGTLTHKVARRSFHKQVTTELWEWRILGEKAEQAQRPHSRNASEEAEVQEEANVEEAESGRMDGDSNQTFRALQLDLT